MAEKVIIYGKTGCPFSDKAREAYKEHDFFEVEKDNKMMDQMLKFSNGKRQIPVIVQDDQVTIGYGGT